MGRLLLFRVVLYGTAVGLIAFYFFGRDRDDLAEGRQESPPVADRHKLDPADDPLAGAKELLGKTSRGLKTRMYLKGGQVTYFEVGLDWRCPNGYENTSWWNGWPIQGTEFVQSGRDFEARQQTSVREAGVTEIQDSRMRARITRDGRRVEGTARVVVRFADRKRRVDRCESGDVRFSAVR